jgi:esterase/lipase
MAKQQVKLQEEMDYWVKDFEKKIRRTEEMDLLLKETAQNTDFNYELIKSLQKEIQDLRAQIDKIKSATVIALKSRPLKDMNYSE